MRWCKEKQSEALCNSRRNFVMKNKGMDVFHQWTVRSSISIWQSGKPRLVDEKIDKNNHLHLPLEEMNSVACSTSEGWCNQVCSPRTLENHSHYLAVRRAKWKRKQKHRNAHCKSILGIQQVKNDFTQSPVRRLFFSVISLDAETSRDSSIVLSGSHRHHACLWCDASSILWKYQ